MISATIAQMTLVTLGGTVHVLLGRLTRGWGPGTCTHGDAGPAPSVVAAPGVERRAVWPCDRGQDDRDMVAGAEPRQCASNLCPSRECPRLS